VEVLRRAEAHFDALLRKRPGDIRVRVTLTNVRGSLGTLYGSQGQTAEREACLQGARDLWEALARQRPGEAEAREWLAVTVLWQARGCQQGQVARELRLQQQAAALWQELAQEQPGALAVHRQLASIRFAWLRLALRSGPEDALPPFEEERALLGRRLAEGPTDPVLRQRLALACLVVAEYHHGRSATPKAIPFWREAYEHYRQLPEAQLGPLAQLNLALCCCRLVGSGPAGPDYPEAVERLERARSRLAALAAQHPDEIWLPNALLEAQCFLAVCHWKAGRADLAEQTIADRVRPFAASVGEGLTDPQEGVAWLSSLLRAAGLLREANRPATLALARQAAALADRYADSPARDGETCARLAAQSLGISTLLCQLGDGEEALRQAELARHLLTGLCRAAPRAPEHGQGLSSAWERIGKARWALAQRDEALAAFRQAAAVQRQVLAQAPADAAYRRSLSRCYDRLVYWGGLHGDRATAAAALREREKLWPGNADELLEVARDFEKLAAAVGPERGPLSAEEQAERQQYLAESERARRAWR
jgi:tetratricopeptide (TPR) repeat protein